MNKNDFFREATLRICGNLEIEQAMSTFLKYIQDYIPADRLLLEYFDKNAKVMRTIADATLKKGLNVDLITPLSDEARAFLKNKYKDGIPEPYYYDKPNEVSLTRELLAFHKQEAESILVLPLGTQSILVGVVTLISTHSQYNEKHLELASLLKEPFQIAMSNALKHRNELKLFNRDFFWEVTMRICGNLKIEEGLRACLEYISLHIPADSLYLLRYESNLGSNRIIARANAEKAEPLDILIQLPKQPREVVDERIQAWKDGTSPPVNVYNEPDLVRDYILDSLGEPSSSVMGLPLVLEGQVAGALNVLAKGNNRFDENHQNLFATLKLPFFVAMSNALKHKEILHLKDLLVDDNRFLQTELKNKAGEDIIGSNFGLKGVMEKVRQVARMDSPVLLLGETGVGKDVIANAIHYLSTRYENPFVSVNCGAIPDTLIDSELFGHEKGAFTGALIQKRGRFERADKGTIFLDEIGELPLQAQVRFLKVLQSKEIERVGGVKTIPLDIRIIAATNRKLEEMVKLNQFREDLWFRLNVFPIWVPPLRDRKSDIPALLQHFISLKSRELKLPAIPTVSPGVTDILMNYHWPGNVRELQNVVERELIVNPTGPLNFSQLTVSLQSEQVYHKTSIFQTDNLDEITSIHIRNVLKKTGGKIHGKGGAADLLGINASTLRNRMNKLGISYGRASK